MTESIMKTGRRGRLRYTAEQKKTMVDASLTSGLSAPRFAAHHGVNDQTLVSWIKKDKMAGRTNPSSSPIRVFWETASPGDRGNAAVPEIHEIDAEDAAFSGIQGQVPAG